MKRRFFRASWMLALAGLVAFSLVGTSCGDDDEDPKPDPTPVNPDPVNPDPVNPDPVNPDPVNPDPVNPDPTPAVKNHVIVVKASDMVDHEWDTQFWFYSPTKFVEGDSWEVSIDVKADKSTAADVANGISTQTHKDNAGGYIHWAAIGGVTFTEEWVTYTASGTFTAEQVDGDYVAFNLNDFNPANNYYFDNLSFKVNGTEQIKNGDIEGTDFSSFFIKEYPATDAAAVAAANVIEMDGKGGATPTPDPEPTPEPSGKSHVIVVKSSDMVDHEWDTQFWFYSPTKFVEGDSWEVSMRVKATHSTAADVANGISTQTHKDNAGGYIHWAAIGGVTFTEEWVTYTNSGTFTAEQVDGDYVAFNLNDYNPANDYYFDDISFKVNGTEQIKNGDIEGTDFSSFFIKEYPATDAANVTAANVVEQ